MEQGNNIIVFGQQNFNKVLLATRGGANIFLTKGIRTERKAFDTTRFSI